MGALVLTVVVAGSRPSGPEPGLAESLRPQLASGAAELVVVSAAPKPPDLGDLPNVRVQSLPSGTTVPTLRAEGLRMADAPFVAITEDFCVPAQGWAEALLSGHRTSHAPVVGGPVQRRRGSNSDWARSFVEYGRFMARGEGAHVEDLSGTNVAYEIAAVSRTLGGLPGDFQPTFIHARLREGGLQLWKEPGALMFDESRLGLGTSIRAMYHHGRLYGGERLEGARWPRRVIRALLSPLVPAVHLLRITRNARQARLVGRLTRSLLPLLALELAWACGECVGSLCGAGSSRAKWT